MINLSLFESVSVEFAGAPGTGKSTLVSELEKIDQNYITLDDVYRRSAIKGLTLEYPIFSNRFFSILLKASPLGLIRYGVSRITGLNSRMIIRYSEKFPDSLRTFEKLAKKYPSDDVRRVSALNMILPTIDKYMITEKYWENGKILLIDEGFVQRGGSIFTPPEPSKEISEEDVAVYSENISVPDLLILLKVDPEIAESRLKKRAEAYHSEYEKLNKREMMERIKRYDRFFDIISKVLRARDVKVVEIDADRDIDVVVQEVDATIKKAVDLKDGKINLTDDQSSGG